VYLELGDHLGSTSVVLDHATGELVQRDTAYAYGAAESSYRPEKFEEFREDYRFTGKEDDVEVGLIYFGKRYYAPLLQRWISADPLAIHAPGEADLNLYAYVHGRVLVAVDPVGLEGEGIGERILLVLKGAGTAYREDALVRIHAEQKDAAFVNTVFGQTEQAEAWEGRAAQTEQRIADRVHYNTTEENVGRLMFAGGRVAAGMTAIGAGLSGGSRRIQPSTQRPPPSAVRTPSSSSGGRQLPAFPAAGSTPTPAAVGPSKPPVRPPARTVVRRPDPPPDTPERAIPSSAEGPETAKGSRVLYHYTDAPASSFKKEGLRAGSSATTDPNYSADAAIDYLGLKKAPNKIIPVVDNGHFEPNRPFIVPEHPNGMGGGTDYTNPRTVPASDILPARPLKK
jgi:RHS repeat-associated protein